MSLKIPHDTGFSEGLKSKIKDQCTIALDLITTRSKSDPHHVIHEVRKSFKKIRAALRLVRDHVDFYKDENVFFRDEGRRISDIRDATSVIEALDMLYDQYSDELYKHTFNSFRNFLLERRKELAKAVLEDKNALSTVEGNLLQKKEEIDSWSINIKSFDAIYPSIKRVYKRGKKAYEKAIETQRTEDLHEWRKRVKYLRYQLDLINRIWPDMLDTWEDELHKLSDHLGNDRDLYMLDNLMQKNKGKFSDITSYQLLSSLLTAQRKELQQRSFLLGQRLYHLEKDTFTGLIEASWKAYERKNEVDFDHVKR